MILQGVENPCCLHNTLRLPYPVKTSNLDEHPNGNQPHLVLLFSLLQIFLRELYKSYRLIQVIPMDMSGYYENRAGPSNLGNVFGILLCKQITPDFNQEELNSIKKDSHEIGVLMAELQEHMPQYDTHLERNPAGLDGHAWPPKRRRTSIYKNLSLFCCISRPNYL
uniref:Uncharacterized protein n=1 Tax=Glossina pallidipes TaxID=7398 RepID=A0A1A9Z2E8_GLOPL